MSQPSFLDLAEVLDLHREQIEHFGGDPGVRDMGLLDSAVSQPIASAFGEPLHQDLFEQAAAYLFHIVRNHPFVDGNKRTGTFAALVFLEINDVEVDADPDDLADLTISIADGRGTKEDVTRFLREHARPGA